MFEFTVKVLTVLVIYTDPIYSLTLVVFLMHLLHAVTLHYLHFEPGTVKEYVTLTKISQVLEDV